MLAYLEVVFDLFMPLNRVGRILELPFDLLLWLFSTAKVIVVEEKWIRTEIIVVSVGQFLNVVVVFYGSQVDESLLNVEIVPKFAFKFDRFFGDF